MTPVTSTPVPVSPRTHRRRSWSNLFLALAFGVGVSMVYEWALGERESVEVGAEPRGVE